MALSFDKIPSVVEIAKPLPKLPTVADEIEFSQQLLALRSTVCKPIKPLRATRLQQNKKKMAYRYLYKFFCVCPRFKPNYPCQHAGNIIIDRDVLTKEEHLCFLATPKSNFAAFRKAPRFYTARTVVTNTTSRIVDLAKPKMKRVEGTLADFKNIISKKRFEFLSSLLAKTPEVKYTTINTALDYIEEERRLKRVAKQMNKRRCRKMKNSIKRKQARQISKIICVLFEEMRDFLLNDQFLIDEQSTLCAVILEQIRTFTDKEFYTTSNLREYQQILANNLTVWINKFISNLDIHVAPPPCSVEQPEGQSFLPVKDYISCTESYEDEQEWSDGYTAKSTTGGGGPEEQYELTFDAEQATDETLKNANLQQA